ncbi:MAG TPA: hypothetical protein V6C81_07360 [Planktothrix sp.]
MTDDELQQQHKQLLLATLLAPSIADIVKIRDDEVREKTVTSTIQVCMAVVDAILRLL